LSSSRTGLLLARLFMIGPCTHHAGLVCLGIKLPALVHACTVFLPHSLVQNLRNLAIRCRVLRRRSRQRQNQGKRDNTYVPMMNMVDAPVIAF